MNVKIINCADDIKLQEAEDRLQMNGFSRVYKQSEKDLRPGEYYIIPLTGTVNDPLADTMTYTLHVLLHNNNK